MKRHTQSRGQALVEFSLLLPILGVMLLGILDLAGAYHLRDQLSHASWSAVSYAQYVENKTTNKPITVADVKHVALVTAPKSQVTVCTESECPAEDANLIQADQTITVSVTESYSAMLHFLPLDHVSATEAAVTFSITG